MASHQGFTQINKRRCNLIIQRKGSQPTGHFPTPGSTLPQVSLPTALTLCLTHIFSRRTQTPLHAGSGLVAPPPAISLNRTPRTGFCFVTFVPLIAMTIALNHYIPSTFTITLFNSIHYNILQGVCLFGKRY